MRLSKIKVVRANAVVTSPHGAACPAVVYIPLPRELWINRPGGKSGKLDTLALALGAPTEGPDQTWMVHRPDLHVPAGAPAAVRP